MEPFEKASMFNVLFAASGYSAAGSELLSEPGFLTLVIICSELVLHYIQSVSVNSMINLCQGKER